MKKENQRPIFFQKGDNFLKLDVITLSNKFWGVPRTKLEFHRASKEAVIKSSLEERAVVFDLAKEISQGTFCHWGNYFRPVYSNPTLSQGLFSEIEINTTEYDSRDLLTHVRRLMDLSR